MARQRIGDAGADFHVRRVQRHGGHVDIGFAPDEMRVADPDVTEPQLFREFGELDHFLQRLGWKKSNTKFHRTHGIIHHHLGSAVRLKAEGREGEGRGRPMREVRLMAINYRPRSENLRPEASLLVKSSFYF